MTALRRASRRARARVASAFIIGAATMATIRTAHATPSARLVYVRGPDTTACPDEASLRRAVATRIGYDPFFPAASKTVIAQVSRARTGYRGKIQIIGDDGVLRGERELATRGDDCSELISAMALAVSIALDDLDDGPHAAAGAPPASTASPSEPAPEGAAASAASQAGAASGASAPSDAAPPAPTNAARSAPVDDGVAAAPTGSSRFAIGASVGPVVSFGAAPGPALGGAVAATVRYAWAGARFDLRADLPSSGDLTGGGQVTTSAVLATAALCVRGDVPFVCGGGGLGSFAATTGSIPRPASDHALLAEVLAIAGADVSLSGRVFVEPFAELGLVLTRHRVSVDGVEAYRLPALAAMGGIHLGWRFL